MSGRRVYPWPERIGDGFALPATRRESRRISTAASKFAQRRGWVYRTRSDRGHITVRRVA